VTGVPERTAPRVRTVEGPVRYLAEHPALHALSLLGAAGAAGAFALRAARATGTRRLGWAALAALELGVVAGILAVPRRRP
jgi:hypothetical protein